MLPKEIKVKLERLLKKYVDVFAWEPKDMVGLPRELGEHRLNINPAYTPVVQKKEDDGERKERGRKQRSGRVGTSRSVATHTIP